MKNDLTFAVLDAMCKKQAGIKSENEISLEARQKYINAKLMKIYGLMDGESDPFYNRITALTVAADQELLTDDWCNGGVITAIDIAANTITRNSGVFVAGSLLSISVIDAISGIVEGHWGAWITTGGATAVYAKIGAGTEKDFANVNYAVTVTVEKALSASSVDVSGIYFKDFIAIYDDRYTSTPGAKKRLFDMQTDPDTFYNHDKEALDAKHVWWMQQGDTIYLSVGPSANALGTVIGNYRGKPNQYTDATAEDEIDIKPEWNQMLIDEVVASYCIETGGTVPQDVSARLAMMEKMYEASAKNKLAALERKNKV